MPAVLMLLHIDSYPKNIHCVSSLQCLLHLGATNHNFPISMPLSVLDCHTNERIKTTAFSDWLTLRKVHLGACLV